MMAFPARLRRRWWGRSRGGPGFVRHIFSHYLLLFFRPTKPRACKISVALYPCYTLRVGNDNLLVEGMIAYRRKFTKRGVWGVCRIYLRAWHFLKNDAR